MSMPREQQYKKRTKNSGEFIWNKKYEYTANTAKFKKWMKEHGYSYEALYRIIGVSKKRGHFILAKGIFTVYEAKKLAIGVGMSLYDFIDIFLSDIYPVTPEDFDILGDDEE